MKVLRFIIKSALFVALVLVIGAGLIVYQMSSSSVRIGFLKERISTAIAAHSQPSPSPATSSESPTT